MRRTRYPSAAAPLCTLAKAPHIAIEGLSARTPNGGSIEVTGRVAIDPGRGFPGDIRIVGRRAQLAERAEPLCRIEQPVGPARGACTGSVERRAAMEPLALNSS